MRNGRVWRTLATVAVVAAVSSPAVTGHDSFPLSTYPMYAHDRASTAVLRTAIGVTSTGPVPLSLASIADPDDPLVAQGRLRDAVRRDETAVVCDEIASRVTLDARLARVDLVEVVEVDVDLRSGDELGRVVLARCVVAR